MHGVWEMYIYRYFDTNGRLLYVGVTSDPEKRDQQHRATQPAADIASTTYECAFGRPAALRLERAAIKSEHPLHNKVGA